MVVTCCWSIDHRHGTASAALRSGIIVDYCGSPTSRPYALDFRVGYSGWDVGMNKTLCPTNTLDVHQSFTLYEAALSKVGPRDSDYEFVPRRSGVGFTLLYVHAEPHLVFSPPESSRPHFDRTAKKNPVDTWIGADAFYRSALVRMTGKWPDTTKKQLFSLPNGAQVVLIDSRQVVTLITARQAGEPPSVSRATENDVADYVLQQAIARGRGHDGKVNISTIRWCEKALYHLGCNKQIDALNKKYGTYLSQ